VIELLSTITATTQAFHTETLLLGLVLLFVLSVAVGLLLRRG
jgi:hypothetical protein